MTRRSKLLATVAIPVLSLAIVAKPAAASPLRLGPAVLQSQLSDLSVIELAQAVVCADGAEAQDQATCDAREAQRQAEAEAQRQAQEAEAQRQAQEAEAQRQAQEAEAQKQAQEAEAQRQAQEAEAQKQAQEAEAQRQAQEAEAQKQAQEAEAQRQAQEAEAQKQAQEAEAQRQAQEAEAQKQAQEAEAQKQAAEAEARRQAAEAEAKRQAEQQAQQPAQAPAATAAVTCADGSQAASAEACPAPPATAEQPATQAPVAEQPANPQAPVAEQPAPPPADQPAVAQPDGSQPQPPVAEQPVAPTADGQAAPAQQAGEGQPQPDGQQVVVPATVPPADAPVAEIVETMTEEQKQDVADDPSKTAETVVLPVDGGAAVLDSDKDADNRGGAQAREARTEQRAQEKVVAAPESDAAAQADIKVDAQAIQAAATEDGTRLQAAPTFAVPPTVVNNITNVTNVTNVTNNTVNNVNNGVQNNTVNQVTEVKVIEQVDNRTIINVGNQVVVRSNDRERLRYDAEESYYEELSRGRVRETIIRNDDSRIVTVYNRYGDIIQRSRISPRGREYVLIYAPEADREEARVYVDVGLNLPPMRLTVPVSDYIVTTSRAPDRDYYEFLAEPPVERVERVYSIDEVKSSARLRDKVRRIDLDTITFPSGSAEVPLEQARTLRKVAEAMEKVLDNDPGETFLIEGHTDAVGSDRSNLILSDKRAETVASLLTDVYGIPPENLQIQGYGERYLKIRTLEDEQQNRRVAIRRVTSLVRPVAANQ